ncbi:MAG TPA: DUF4157 domain-containing protein [Gammaproteobacteria bacterium]|nr:DUF4157 domain-containing protein [Gammaproteobacteria bacterium]
MHEYMAFGAKKTRADKQNRCIFAGRGAISENIKNTALQMHQETGVVPDWEARACHGDDLSWVPIQDLALRGASGSASPFPYQSEIQEVFGDAYDLSRVKTYVGGSAAEASARHLSAEAYTVGEQVVFARRPSLWLAAHEATHVFQQMHGARPSGGVGRAGDAYERQADAVADMVVSRKAVSGNLLSPPVSGGNISRSRNHSVQMYTTVTGEPYNKLADDRKLAVRDHTRNAWAESSNIAASNKVLKRIKAVAEIEELSTGSITLAPPGGGASVTLKKFRMREWASGNEAQLPDDCGSACQVMLGANAAGYMSFVARNLRGTTEEFTSASTYHGDDNAPGGTVSTTEKLSGEIYIRIFKREFGKSLSRINAVKEWDKLSSAKKNALSKKYGINAYAVPRVGQGITIGSERDMPGGGVAASGAGTGYNFHFALNLLASGHDYITLEDYASSGVKYYFDMYGPHSKGQSWAEASSNVNALGAKTTTMVVQHPESLKGIVNTDRVYFEADPGRPRYNRTLAKDTKIKIIRKGHSWMKVEVISGAKAGERGWILNKYFTDN